MNTGTFYTTEEWGCTELHHRKPCGCYIPYSVLPFSFRSIPFHSVIPYYSTKSFLYFCSLTTTWFPMVQFKTLTLKSTSALKPNGPTVLKHSKLTINKKSSLVMVTKGILGLGKYDFV